MKKLILSTIRLSLLILLLLSSFNRASAQTDTVRVGSFIINMGVTPQTYQNGLLPYGLIYELTQGNNVPVMWSINPAKVKDGHDFLHGTDSLKGGTFIVPGEFRDATIDSVINIWTTKGVIGFTTTIEVVVPFFEWVTTFPRTVLDEDNGGIVEDYFVNAEIPDSLYREDAPSGLTVCDDFFAWPHADPVWETHKNLYRFVTEAGGYIWGGCHAVSVIEGLTNPGTGANDTTLNFLTTAGLQCFSDGKCGPIPGSHGSHTDPIMFNGIYSTDPIAQYMGITDGAQDNGSEDWYIPWPSPVSSQWRPTSKRIVTTSDGVSPGEGVKMVYGYAYGDSTNGQVMYEAGHSIDNGPEEDAVAAQRAFFNFYLMCGINNRAEIDAEIGAQLIAQVDSTFSMTAAGGTPPYTYDWRTTCSGVFTQVNDSTVKFTPDSVSLRQPCRITAVVTDSCYRKSFATVATLLYPFNYPPIATYTEDSTAEDIPTTIFLSDYVTDLNIEDSHTFTILTTTVNGTSVLQGDTSVLYSPTIGFDGLDSLQYIVCDDGLPQLCDTAWLRIRVMGDCDHDGIFDVYEGIGEDQDLDGINNECDFDVDNDGIVDTEEGTGDFDGDGVPNFKDTDSDNDGIPDALEAFGMTTPATYDNTLGWNLGTDTDSDGLIDLFDNAPAVAWGPTSTSNIANPDTDGDGLKNIYDLDSDQDGIVDAIEHNEGILPTNMNSNGQYSPSYAIMHDSYLDGLINGVDPKSGAGDNDLLFSDADANPDYLDIDSDNDGIVDNREGQTTLGYLSPTGNDSDNDGIDNAYDINAGGAPLTPPNTDNNDTPDYIDLDADNDFVVDLVEGHDPNSDGVPNTTPSASDTDGDGLDNNFDTVNGFTASGNSTGNNAAIQDTDGDGEKDWRDRDDDDDGYLTIDETPDIDPANGTPDYLETSPQACPPGATSTGPPTNGNGDAWSIMAGSVDNPVNSIGVPDGIGAKVKDNDGWLMVDLTDTIPQGSTITLVIAGDNTSEDAKIFASLDGITHSDTVIYTFTVKDPTYETFIYNVNQATGVRYISVYAYVKHTWLDAVSYSVPTCSPDNDNDHIWNGVDVDDDNDGIPDSLEAYAAGNLNPDNDADSDGIPDFLDVDFASCGGLNSWGVCNNFDTDGDGVADHLDLDSDDDGIPDAYEANAGVLPATMTPEAAYPASYVILNDPNGNGWADLVDPGDGGTQLPYTNTDTDVYPDFLDLDSDDDGIVDNIEAQYSIGYVFRNLDDVDNDGMDDAYDYDLFGKLVPILDTDSDGTPDYIDLDSDGDGVPDNIEGHDANADGIPDLVFAAADLDNDGLRDSYDPDYITCLSTYNGQASNGGCAAIQDTDGDGIRDWRDIDDDNDGNLTTIEDQDALCTGGPGDGLYANDFCEFGNPHPDYLFPILLKANDDFEFTLINTSVIKAVQLNDVYTFPVVTSIVNAPSNGTATLLSADSINYNPNVGYYGWDTTQYQICGTLPAAELLLNGSAETYPFVGTGWIDLTTGSTYLQSNAAPGPLTGAFYFDANSVDVNAELYQDINLSIFADKIDLGTKQFNLDAWVSTNATAAQDQCKIMVEWRNAATLIIGTFDSGFISSPGAWMQINPTLNAPIGTRSVRIRLIGNMTNPPLNSAYFEDISFQTLPELQCDTANYFVRVIVPPIAVNDTIYVAKNDTSQFNPITNDTDLDNNIQNNTVSISGLPGPDDGSVLSIHPVTGLFTYAPNLNFSGIDLMQYQICDSTGLCDTAWVVINVIEPPEAIDDTITLPEDSLYVVSIFLNDTNHTGTIQDSLLQISLQPANGTASADTVAGTITYTPNLNFNGADTLKYIACDEFNLCDTAFVYFTVTPVDDPPVAVDDLNPLGSEDDTLNIYILSNDYDPDNNINPDSVTIITAPVNGTAIFNYTTNLVEYIGNLNFYGFDSLQYEVCDSTALCDTAWVYIELTEDNDAPVAMWDSITVLEDVLDTVWVTANDTDIENNLDTTDVTIISGPFNGTANVLASGEITYVTNLDYFGLDSLIYQVCDSSNGCDTAWLYISILDVIDNPNITDPNSPGDLNYSDTISISLNIYQDTTMCFPVYLPIVTEFGFDSVPIFGATLGGDISVPDLGLNDTCLIYTAPPIVGIDTIRVQLCDTLGNCDTLTIFATITGSEICNDSVDNDVDGLIDCADTLDCRPTQPGVITTSNDTICAGVNGELYSITAVAGATSYDWTVPAGATITAGQGTTTISVNWGSASGNVCVRSYNGFCYSDFSCSYITVNNVPAAPTVILH